MVKEWEVSAGCNRISGSFELTKDKISFSKIASTLMACPDESKNKLEGTLLKMLTDTTFRYDIADQTLNLYQGDKLVLMFGMSPLE
jgi:heat shock protein HslJ